MSEFVELDKPVLNHAFGWYVMPLEPKGDVKFLATDGTLRVRDRTTGFFFKTELDAHHGAISYYNCYSQLYPHGVAMMSAAGYAADNVKSQKMEFK